MSVPIGWPGEFAADTLDGSEAVPVLRNSVETIVTTTADIGDAPSPLGPIATSSVAGTGSAYTATAAQAVVTGRSFWFTPHVENTGVATLSINGGTARSLRTETGTVLTAGLLRPSTQYLIQFDGTLFRVLGLRLTQRFQNRVNLTGTTATLDWRTSDADTLARSRISGSDGRIFLQSGGDGSATNPATAIEIQTSRDARFFGRILNVNNAEVYHPSNPLPTTDELLDLIEEVPAATHETRVEAVRVASTNPHILSPTDAGRHIFVTTTGAWLDCGQMAVHTDRLITVASGVTATVYTGSTTTWTGRTTSRVELAAGRYRVFRGQTDFAIAAYSGTMTDVTTTVPTYHRKIAIIGYSNTSRTLAAVAGWREAFDGWGQNPSVVAIDSGAGASSLWKGAASDPAASWWDQDTASPGTHLAPFLAAIAAAPASPALEAVIVHYGYADMNFLGSTKTEADYVTDTVAMFAYIRTQLSLPSLKFIMCPMGNRGPVIWAERLWYGMRRAQLQVCVSDANAVRGPDSYDLRHIWRDYHPTYRQQARFNKRWAEWHETVFARQTPYLGPKIVDYIEDDATTKRIVIDHGAEGLVLPTAPVGVGILPSGSDFTTSEALPVSRYAWSFSAGPPARYTLTVVLSGAGATGTRLAYPYGSMADAAQDATRVIRSNISLLPLQTYHPTV